MGEVGARLVQCQVDEGECRRSSAVQAERELSLTRISLDSCEYSMNN